MPNSSRPLVLVVDDDRDTRDLYRLVMDLAGYRVLTAGSIAEAVGVSRSEPAAVAVADWRLPDGNGLELASALTSVSLRTALLAVTGVTLTPLELDQAHARGFQRVMQKPLLPDALVAIVGELLDLPPAATAATSMMSGATSARGFAAPAAAPAARDFLRNTDP